MTPDVLYAVGRFIKPIPFALPMKLFLLALLPFAGLACTSTSGTDVSSTSPSRGAGVRKVAASTAGHGGTVAAAASVTASEMTAEEVLATSVFGAEDKTSKTLKGTHRQVAASTGSHGTPIAAAASTAAIETGKAHEAEKAAKAEKP